MNLEFSESYRVGGRPECEGWGVWVKEREMERREEKVHEDVECESLCR